MTYYCPKCGKTYESPVRVLAVSHVCPKVVGKQRVTAMKLDTAVTP